MRYREIDIFKGILTVLMILAHCLQFFCKLKPGSWEHTLSEYINLTTFSGFIFAFGFSSWYAYINKPYKQVWRRIVKNCLRMLAAYYISAFSFCIFIEGLSPLHKGRIKDILLLKSLAGWSEFLLSFAALMLLILIFQPLMRKAGARLAPAIAILAIAACLIPLKHGSSLLGTFIGQTDTAVFAIIPYCVYFAVGVYLAQSGAVPSWKTGLVSLLCTGVFLAFLIKDGAPSRFPLSLPWLAGAALFLYLYYLAALKLTGFSGALILEGIGKNSLYYLLLSNILIFSVKSSDFFQLKTGFAFMAFLIILLICFYTAHIIQNDQKQLRANNNILRRDNRNE